MVTKAKMNRRRFFPAAMFSLSVTFLGFLPQTNTTSKKAKTEPIKDTTWLTYVEPGEYSFEYPPDWKLELRWKNQIPGLTSNIGFEILSLLRHPPDVLLLPICGLSSNVAKLSLSIASKDSNTLEGIAGKRYGVEYEIKRMGEEKLKINGQNAIRSYFIHDGHHIAIITYLDYKDEKYVRFGGMFGNGRDSASLANDFKRIQNSLKILK